ncbi:MAG: hypothetical protein AAF546_10755 [Verrucomicrobiota bacterium]
MSDLPNLTDQISRLRDRSGGSDLLTGHRSIPKKTLNKSEERKLAPDFLMVFIYGLVGIALMAQLAIIVWLNLDCILVLIDGLP